MRKRNSTYIASTMVVLSLFWQPIGERALAAVQDGVLLDPDASVSGVLQFIDLQVGFYPLDWAKCAFQTKLENYKINEWVRCKYLGRSSGSTEFHIRGEFLADGSTKQMNISSTFALFPMTGSFEHSEGAKGGKINPYPSMRAVLALSNTEYERRKLLANNVPEPQPALSTPQRAGSLVSAPELHADPPANNHAVAVIIGNKTYGGKIPIVDFAHNDAAAMKRFVTKVLGYLDSNVIDLRDATGTQIEAVLGSKDIHEGKLFDWIRPGESDVLVFYSGHGVPGLRDKRPYLLPVDGDPNRAEITGYSVDVLYSNLAKIPAKSVTVFLDACFSGESPKGMILRAASGISVTAKLPRTQEALTILTAARGDQLASWDEEAGHGLFTKHLLEGLYQPVEKGAIDRVSLDGET